MIDAVKSYWGTPGCQSIQVNPAFIIDIERVLIGETYWYRADVYNGKNVLEVFITEEDWIHYTAVWI